MKRVSKDELEALKNSGLFDERYYLEQYPDVKMLGMSALEHYLWIGKKLGRRITDSGQPNATAQVDQNVIVCDSTGNGLPDLFSLRARQSKAARSVVAYAGDYAQLNALQSILGTLETEFDLVLTVPTSLSETAKSVIEHIDYSLVIYPEQFCPAN